MRKKEIVDPVVLDRPQVKAELCRRGTTQRQLAAELGIAEMEISFRLRAGQPVPKAFAEEIARRLGCPVSNLIC